jgi:hypothetical protein
MIPHVAVLALYRRKFGIELPLANAALQGGHFDQGPLDVEKIRT